MSSLGILKREATALMIIDIQERLMPVIDSCEEVFANTNKLLAGASILTIPVVVTEQYTKGLGHTCEEISLSADHRVIEKICFSSMLNSEVTNHLHDLKIRSLIVAGVESHICVLKTALDALAAGFEVHIVADAVSSRKRFDKEMALARMRQAGAFIVTTEMVLFQLIDEAGNDQFKQISRLIK